MLYQYLKRAFDIFVAVCALFLLSPLLLLIALLVRFRLGSPILFRQLRPGLKGRPFQIVKFRTMTDGRDRSGNLLPDEARLPRFGSFLRSTSLDELPEILNVLKGEMSLVGPRPLMMDYLEHYSAEQMRRHDVTPGITGWAQINGRNDLTWEQKFAMDLWYVDHRSAWLDIRILAVSIGKILRRDGIARGGYVTTSDFTGTRESERISSR